MRRGQRTLLLCSTDEDERRALDSAGQALGAARELPYAGLPHARRLRRLGGRAARAGGAEQHL